MHNDYTRYKLYDFLEDEFFICSIKRPTEESVVFWEKEKNKPDFNQEDFDTACLYIRSVRIEQKEISDVESVALWNKINIRNQNQKRHRKHILYYSVASCVAVLIVCFALFFRTNGQHIEPDIAVTASLMKTEKISDQVCLILSNDKEIVIAENNADIHYSPGGEIQINTQQIQESISEKQIKYNQLTVPFGKRTTLTLSDGSRLWLNAGTRMVYPVVFDKEKREIFVDGEVFLDVQTDENCPFIVKTHSINVQVLGTSFSVMAYKEEDVQAVVLVNGSVEVESPESKVILKPNEMFEYKDGKEHVMSVDVTDYILWKEGLYVFRSEKLSVIMARLSRYYGKTIECDARSSDYICNGKLDLKEDLEHVLNGVSQAAPVHWTFRDDKYKFSANQ